MTPHSTRIFLRQPSPCPACGKPLASASAFVSRDTITVRYDHVEAADPCVRSEKDPRGR